MLKAGSDVFVQDPRRETRFLHRARVTAIEGASCRVEIDPDAIRLDGENALLVYFHDEADFLQQVMEVDRQEGAALELHFVGDPISADQRQQERISTVSANLAARIGEELDCPVHDVSATGFAAVAPAGHRLGEIVEVSLEWEGRCYVGRATVQSLREVGRRRVRYGLRLLGNESGPGKPLHAELPAISLAIQRSQQRRFSGES
jgi:hypothetical protein